MVKRIGITTRITEATGYNDPRDALSQDWPIFLRFALPDVVWLAVPNVGEEVEAFVTGWHLDGLVLSGGDSIGAYPLRDDTEERLLRLAVDQSLPLFGVCRGLQVIQRYFGGEMAECHGSAHVGLRHDVRMGEGELPLWVRAALPEGRRDVNSYHGLCVGRDQLASDLTACALTDRGEVEAVCHRTNKIGAVMWHPEREKPFNEEDRAMLRAFFELP